VAWGLSVFSVYNREIKKDNIPTAPAIQTVNAYETRRTLCGSEVSGFSSVTMTEDCPQELPPCSKIPKEFLMIYSQ
jgi:hypothetical protein